jgi:outer membrane protein, heavy metal efflux system
MVCRSLLLFCLISFTLLIARESIAAQAQEPQPNQAQSESDLIDAEFKQVSNAILPYYDSAQGISALEMISRAVTSNTELAAARLELARARARVRQAGLRPNPSVDFEYQSGRIAGSGDDGTTTVGISLPIELGGKRGRRIDLAEAELAATEAEIADRERKLAADIYSTYAEALAAIRELEIITRLTNIETQTTNIVEVRVKEGENPPLDLNLLKAEVGRLQARRTLVEARLQGAMIKLKNFIALPITEPLKLREDLTSVSLTSLPGQLPTSLEAAIEAALQNRPDLKLAQLNEAVAQAGLKLARAQAVPDLTAFTKYSRERSTPICSRSSADLSIHSANTRKHC